MSGQSRAAIVNANSGGEKPCTRTGKVVHPIFSLAPVLRALWPVKTAATLVEKTGASERAVKYWLAGNTRMSVGHIARLLRSDEGFSILDAIMAGSSARWWRLAQLAHEQATAIRTGLVTGESTGRATQRHSTSGSHAQRLVLCDTLRARTILSATLRRVAKTVGIFQRRGRGDHDEATLE